MDEQLLGQYGCIEVRYMC